MTFALIPAGTFTMGSPASEQGRFDSEVQHQVTLSKPFYMQTTAVTQAQWYALMGDNPSCFKGPVLPVDSVSWYDVQEFIKKLNQTDQKGTYRLSTEAEWEYACRAGSHTAYCFGGDTARLGEYAWYKDNSGKQTHPVGQKKPNAWGLYDMHGNVLEWCQDRYDDYPYRLVRDPVGPFFGCDRVMRGGGCYDSAGGCRSANRYYDIPNVRYGNIGFRLVLLPGHQSGK
jgi:formylglycine-generating enzyme required for sulfatase activity